MAKLSDWQMRRDRIGPILRECLQAAIAAASVHNTQPWRFRPRSDGIDVYADDGRRLQVIDPDGRQLLMSVGAALFNLRVAILAHGRAPIVRLLPTPEDPGLVADVTFGDPLAPSVSVRMLARAIPRRRTNRRAFSNAVPPAGVLAEIIQAAEAEGGRLAFAEPGIREAVLCLVRLAEHREASDPGYLAELGAWTHWTQHRRDGVPPQAHGPWNASETVPIRDFGLVVPAAQRGTEDFESEPTIAMLYSRADSPRDWLVAGQALERVLLTATARGVATTLMTQPTEVMHLRDLLTDSCAGLVPQALIRFGYGPPCAASPRRPVEEVLDRIPVMA